MGYTAATIIPSCLTSVFGTVKLFFHHLDTGGPRNKNTLWADFTNVHSSVSVKVPFGSNGLDREVSR